MPEELTIIYPTLDLFIYDLRSGLGQDSNKLNQNLKNFWQKVYNQPQYNKLGKQLDEELLGELAKAENPEASFVELLGSKQIEFFEQPLDGYYYPLQLGDTYALQVDCSGRFSDGDSQHDNQPQPISNIKLIQQEIFAHIGGKDVKGNIGQTWVMWGQLTPDIQRESSIEQVAKECYAHLTNDPNWERDFDHQGEFLTASVFEFWRPAASLDAYDDSYHLLILLFPHSFPLSIIQEQIAKAYPQLLRLFYYRHKITWAYYQSHYYKAVLKKDYVSVKKSIQKISQFSNNLDFSSNTSSQVSANQIEKVGSSENNSTLANVLPNKVNNVNSGKLKQLEQTLTHTLNILTDYAINLSGLNAQAYTIKINIGNYQKRVNQIVTKHGENDRKFLEEFSNFATERYQGEVEAESAYLSTGLTLLENLIKTIEGISNIEQTKSDRQLENLIAATGVGVGTASIIASTFPTVVQEFTRLYGIKVDKNQFPLAEPISNLLIVLLFSLGLGGLAGWGSWKIMRSRSHSNSARVRNRADNA
ncbi:hypothetical protein Cri9333_4477 [Crinalium epipsammum PCC 9333]|uniref:Uncharacterized protein n=1 Tax=Crinalium epipsammum PCC 9333 TaxID=1173022 RepID=K9W633_9CYAN|nr:hypothetical protein [Crinalium epipsammum]AFZ15259.1 hypothetical protein Cri9333_4477 [Crinalium epipsammum PCC 9333]